MKRVFNPNGICLKHHDETREELHRTIGLAKQCQLGHQLRKYFCITKSRSLPSSLDEISDRDCEKWNKKLASTRSATKSHDCTNETALSKGFVSEP